MNGFCPCIFCYVCIFDRLDVPVQDWSSDIDYVFSFKASYREFTLDLEEAWAPFLVEYL